MSYLRIERGIRAISSAHSISIQFEGILVAKLW